MKKGILSIFVLVVIVVVLSVLPTTVCAERTSGECGSNLQWSYNEGTLTITGSGDMFDNQFEINPIVPWEALKETITTVNLPSGMTSIGYGAFAGCTNLTTVNGSEHVKYIGPFAFASCSKLQSICFGENLKGISYDAFSGCSSLTTLRLPKGTTWDIGSSTGLSALETVETYGTFWVWNATLQTQKSKECRNN